MPCTRPRLRVLAAALALGAAAAFAAGCGGDREPAPGGGDAPANVVLVVIDTLRRDHLGLHGHARPTSPVLDRFAAGATVFDHAYATAPWTRPSVASMFTGLYPSAHGSMALNNMLPAGVDTLAERLARAGYATAGVVSHVIISEKFGFDQGFALWDEEEAKGHDHLSTPGVTDRALAALDTLAADEPFFLFVHYFDPHYEYLAHPEVGFEPATGPTVQGGEDIEALRERRRDLAPADLDYLRARYDEEIRITDAGLGRLLEGLERKGVADRTVVAVTSDHGEEFMERGWIGHTRTLYQELVTVPLVVRGRAGAAGHGTRVGRTVSLVSLAPTLLELAGVEADAAAFEGPSLAAFVAGGEPPRTASVFAEVDFRGPVAKQARKKAVIGPRFKLIRNDRRGTIEVYDLVRDPGERVNLAGDGSSPAVDALQRQLYDFSTRELPALEAPDEAPLDPELRERLRRLGYVEEDAPDEPDAADAAPGAEGR